MKRWKQVKDQLDAKRNASSSSSNNTSSNNNDANHPPSAQPYMGGGISSASFSDLRQLPSQASTSSLMPPITKSASRTSLDIPGRLSNFINKSTSSLDIGASAIGGSSNKVTNVFRKFPRPRVGSTSSFTHNDAAFPSTSSPSKANSPRKWVNSLLNQAAPGSQHLETAAQARSRALSDASRPSPAPVSALVLSHDDPPTSSSPRIYTIDSGLQRPPSAGGRSASIYSSHLSAASRSTPDLHNTSVTRHRDNGALLMDLASPLPSIANRRPNPDAAQAHSPLVVRNLDEAPRGTFTPSIPAPSASAQLRTVSRLRNPWSAADSPRIQSEEDDNVDASIAHDRSTNQIDPAERAVLDMLDSASGIGSAVSAPVPPTPYHTATPGTLARSRSFATTTKFDSPASEYSQDFRSPFLAGTSSPAAGVRAAIRQRELLDSNAGKPASPAPIPHSRSALSPKTMAFLDAVSTADTEPIRANQTSSASFYQRGASASTSDVRPNAAGSGFKRISRVPVPQPEVHLASPPTSASSNVFPRRGTNASTHSHLPISPMDSSLLGSSAHATSLWSRPGNMPDTPSTSQDVTSPTPWSANSLAPNKHHTQSHQSQSARGMYALEPVVTPSEVEEDEERLSDTLRPSSIMPKLRRNQTDFTEATSIFSGAEAFRTSENSLQKEAIAEDPAPATTENATDAEAPVSTSWIAGARPLSHVGSVSSSLAALRGIITKAASSALPLTGAAAATSDSPSRPTTSGDTVSATSVAAATKEFEQRLTSSRPSSPEKLSIPSSPTKAKDLIRMFESTSGSASPSDLSQSISRSRLSPTKCTPSATSSLNNTPKRPAPLALSISRSNLGLAASPAASELATEEASPVATKLRAQRYEAGRFRARRAGLIGAGGAGDDASFADDNDDDGADENAAPESVFGETRSVSGRFRSLGVASLHTRSLSTPSDINGNVLGGGTVSSPPRPNPIGGRSGAASHDRTGSIGTNAGSLSRKGAFRNSVIGFMGVLSGKPTTGGPGDGRAPGSSGQTLAPSFLAERRHSAKSDQDDNVSTASAATQGTTASYRRKKEEGNLPLTSTTAIQMSGEQPGTKPIRAGVLYYFNVHDPNPRWLRVKAVLLPSAVAMSWIPSGGGRENVVLDLRACREVHSVPSPDHPSSTSDIGAASARRQGLGQISPFQLIFDDGVERLAADTAKERVQWVSAVWDVTGTRSPKADSMHESATANSGHDALPKSSSSPKASSRPMADASPARPLVSSLGAGVAGTPKKPASTSNEEAIDRIGSIWKSELSSELTSKDMHPSFGEALAAAASPPPPLPPKEPRPALALTALGQASKASPSSNTPSSQSPGARTTAAIPIRSSASPVRAKVRSWQRPPLDLSTGYVHDLTPKTPTLVNPPSDVIHSTPASYGEDKSTAASALEGSARPSVADQAGPEDAHNKTAANDAADEISPASSPDMDGYESARSQGSLVDEFGPRTPVSEAVFNWTRLDKVSDLDPSDSASQRPARSEYGTIKSNVSGAERKRSTRKKGDEKETTDAAKDAAEGSAGAAASRTPAQLLRDSVLAGSAEGAIDSDALFNASPAGSRHRLGTVIEETQSQAQSTRINASVRSNNRSKLDDLVARAIGTGSVKSPAAKSALSLVSSGSISSRDVGKLLEYLEEQQKERLSREKELEDQIRGFQQVVSDLQKKGSTSGSHRSARRKSSTSSLGGESKATARSARDSELAAMQEKLDKVLDLVTNVVASPVMHKRAKSESATMLTAHDGEDAELARMEGVLAKLLRKMHVSEDVNMTPRSQALVRAAIESRDPALMDEWDRMPVELRGEELIKSMEDRAKHGRDGRHEAIHADYTLRNVSSDMVRGGSAPAGAVGHPGTPIDVDIDPRRRFSATLPHRVASGASIPASVSTSDMDNASVMSRIPPRSWSSERGVPSPPPNSVWDAQSIGSRPASRATTHMGIGGRAPAQNFRMLGDPGSTQATPRPVMVKAEPSYGSLDMEAEIRRRRAQQQAASGASMPGAQLGGWYTPKVAAGMDAQTSTSSVTVDMPNVDKPMPPTPSVRWAVGDIVADPKDTGSTSKEPDGLGLSMASAAVGPEAKFDGPPPTPGVGYAASATGGSAVGSTNGELATILQALKQSELARQTQLQQQTEISRYLNELNAWLERDVVDRSKEWRTLASGVTQLHDELKALKEGRPLPASGSAASLQDKAGPVGPNPHAGPTQPPTLLRPGSTGAVPAVTERGKLAPILLMGDSANAPTSPARKRPAGTRKWNERRSASPSADEGDQSWYQPDDADVGVKSSFKSKAAKAAAAASGALLIRQALREWERFKVMQRAAGKPEDPLPAEATGNPEIDSQLPLPATTLQALKDAADSEDNVRIAGLVRESAEAGYGTQAIIELTRYIESKAPEPESDDTASDGGHLDGDTLMPTPSPYRTRFAVGDEPTIGKGGNDDDDDDGVVKMQTPVPARVAVVADKVKEKEEEVESGSGPTTSALALAVEEILKHLLLSKEEEKKKQTEAQQREAERKQAEEERQRSLLSDKEREKAELVDLLYSRIAADKAAEEQKQKELDPKTAIESLVAAINAQKETEVKSAQAADAALRQMTSELLKTTSEQNAKLVEAVNAASRDMLRSNVQMHAEEFKRLLHKEVSGMFEDVGKIREAKRHLEFEIADLWSIKSRHLHSGGPMPIGYNVPGAFPASPPVGFGPPMSMPMPQIMPMPMHMPAHAPAHISPIPAPAPGPAPAPNAAAGVDSLRAQKKAVKAALKQAVAASAPAAAAPAPAPAAVTPAPAPAPAPAAAAAPAPAAAPAAAAAQVAAAAMPAFLAKKKDMLNPFSINFGPRAPAK